MQTTTNYGLKKPEANDFYNVQDQNDNMDILDAKVKEIENASDPAALQNHISDTNNPHTVTKEQVGLGNVPNVSTNNQTPTYTVPGAVSGLVSGEKLGTAFGKISKAINSLITLITLVGSLETKTDTIENNAGSWIGASTIPSGSETVTITDGRIGVSTFADVYYAEGSKETVAKAKPTYTQDNGSLVITFENALESDVTIAGIHVINPGV